MDYNGTTAALFTSGNFNVEVIDFEKDTTMKFSSAQYPALTNDGLHVVVSERKNRDNCPLRVWCVETEKCVRELEGHQKRVIAITLSPDDTKIASADNEGGIKIWDFKKAKHLATLSWRKQPASVNPTPKHLQSISFDSSSRLLLVNVLRKRPKIWDWQAKEVIQRITGHVSRHESSTYPSIKQAIFTNDNATVISVQDALIWDEKWPEDTKVLTWKLWPKEATIGSGELSISQAAVLLGAYYQKIKNQKVVWPTNLTSNEQEAKKFWEEVMDLSNKNYISKADEPKQKLPYNPKCIVS